MNTFPKQEKLTHKKLIEKTFSNGSRVKAFPLLAFKAFHRKRGAAEIQVMFTVGKKRFKKAVDRNRIKRLLKEAWRLQKGAMELSIPDGEQLSLIVVYTGNAIPSFEEAKKKIKKLIRRLENEHPLPQSTDAIAKAQNKPEQDA